MGLVALAAAGCAGNDMGASERSGGNVVGPGGTLPGGGVAGSGSMTTPGGTGTVPGGGTGTVPGGGTGTVPGTVTGTALPCDVGPVVTNTCHQCHGATLIGGAPMKLLTVEDFQADHVVKTTTGLVGQTVKVYELARMRLNDAARPMPPGGQMQAADKTMLDNWLAMGAIAQDTSGCAGTTDPGGTTDPMNPTGPVTPNASDGSECTEDLYAPIVARPGETCYDFLVHGGQGPTDTTKYTVQTGENYEQFYYSVPWPTGAMGTRFGARFDNIQVLHHWLLFTTGLARTNGSHETVIGTQLGDPNAQLIGGWAVGGCNVEFPPDMGLKLPNNGTMLNVQWHFYNNTGMPQSDGSAVQVCTVPAGTRPNLGGLTWLGTENFFGPLGMPPGMNNFGGICPNDSQGDITIWGFWPHMHQLGRHMKSVVTRASGMMETVFDKPFDFNKQIHYENTPPVVLKPGDRIQSTCTFNNTTPANVPFGPSSDQEMCYQFAFSYPAGALDNGVLSLIGATNTCW
jgi:hypothetical protein